MVKQKKVFFERNGWNGIGDEAADYYIDTVWQWSYILLSPLQIKRRKLLDKFIKLKVREYRYWSVYLHQYQNYLGRCVIWCKRENAFDLAEATEEEIKELLFIIGKLKIAVKDTFCADWFNYSFLGNEVRHLHCHFIPRYSSGREFCGIMFKDSRWGRNYKTDKNFVISEESFEDIKQKIKNALNNTGGLKWKTQMRQLKSK